MIVVDIVYGFFIVLGCVGINYDYFFLLRFDMDVDGIVNCFVCDCLVIEFQLVLGFCCFIWCMKREVVQMEIEVQY